jgi:fumarylacetoacetate (FAA) hydrolase family protein
MTHITTAATLPKDADRAVLIGRAWQPGEHGGPVVVTVRNGELIDITSTTPTVSQLLESANPADKVMQASGPSLGRLDDWLASTLEHGPDPAHRHLLAPNDLQVVKAAGSRRRRCRGSDPARGGGSHWI